MVNIAGLVNRSLALVVVIVLLGNFWADPAAARPLFNQSPETMDHLGSVLIRCTIGSVG
jgi:hypothetical protein